jgi:hypothetical protein
MLKIVLFAMYDIKVKTESRKSSLSWVLTKKVVQLSLIVSGLQYNCFFYNYSVYSFVSDKIKGIKNCLINIK